LRSGKGPARSIELGFEKALSAIVDANVTTLLTAAIMFAVGSGPVRGFSITLGIGIVTSMFTAVYVTRLIVSSWYGWRRPKTIVV
jgi:preprotein translocase subunit SecD